MGFSGGNACNLAVMCSALTRFSVGNACSLAVIYWALTSFSGVLQVSAESVQCHVCQRWMSRADSLKRHIREVHMKVKAHECPLCGRHFSQKCNMFSHIAKKHAYEAKQCFVCSVTFSSLPAWLDHLQQTGHTQHRTAS